MPPKQPLRSTQLVQLRVLPAIAERLQHNAQEMGLNLSEYASALISGEAPIARPAAEGQLLGVIGAKLLRAISLLDVPPVDTTEVKRLLREIQREGAKQRLTMVPGYKEAIKVRGQDDNWADVAA